MLHVGRESGGKPARLSIQVARLVTTRIGIDTIPVKKRIQEIRSTILIVDTGRKAFRRSEKLWYRSGGDWRIDHAQKDREAQEMGQSASFIPRKLILDAMSRSVKQYKCGHE
jgi:hypothetical protein